MNDGEEVYSQEWRINNLYMFYNKKRQLLPFRMNAFQKVIFDYITSERAKSNKMVQILVVKCRQIGISTFFLIFNLDETLFRVGSNSALIAQGRTEMIEMFEKINVAWENFPNDDMFNIQIKQKTAAKYKFEHDSSIRVTLSTRGGTVNNLHISELAKVAIKYPQKIAEIQSGALESVPKEDSIVAIESTAEGAQGYFYDLVQDALDGKNGYKLFFFPWWQDETYELDVPEGFIVTYEEEQLRNIIYEKFSVIISDRKIAWYRWKKSSLKEKMPQEYPSYIEEAFISSGNPFYDINIVRSYSLLDYIEDPKYRELKWYLPDDRDKTKPLTEYLRAYLKPFWDCIIGIDLAEGLESGDYTVIRVRRRNGDLIASYRGHIKPDMVTDIIDHLYNMGLRAMIGAERNNHGHAFIAAAKHCAWYNDMYVEKSIDKISKKPLNKVGWNTTAVSRPLMLDEHEQAVREGLVDMDADLQKELLSFYVINGKAQAGSGRHDDIIMADAICWQMRKEKTFKGFIV